MCAKSYAVSHGGWLKKLAIVFVILLVLLIAAVFVVTSGGFVKSVILPRVAKSLNTDIQAGDVQISPFSSVLVRDLKVQTPGQEPVFTAQEFRARYTMLDIVRGKIALAEVALVNPVVQVVKNADGTSNLDALTKSAPKDKAAPKAEQKSSSPPQVFLEKLAISNGTLRMINLLKDGGRETTEVSNFNLGIDGVGNSRSGKLSLGADLKIQKAGVSSNDLLQAKLTGAFDLALDAALQPATAKGNVRVDVASAEGAFKDLAKLGVVLDCDMTPAEIKDLALRFTQGSVSLGALTVSGPFDVAKQEGKLAVKLAGIDRQLLNLVGAAQGINFNDTAISSSNQIELKQGGKLINASGSLTVASLSVTQKGQTTPPLDIAVAYDVALDQSVQSAVIKAFSITGTQNKKPLLRGQLARPMKVDWGKAAGSVDESDFELVVTGFNLGDWRAFTGDAAPLGNLGAQLKLHSVAAGRKMEIEFATRLDDLNVKSGTNRIDQARVILSATAKIDDFDQVKLQALNLAVSRREQPVMNLSANGQLSAKTQDANLNLKVDAQLPAAVAMLSLPDARLTAGVVKFDGKVIQTTTAAATPKDKPQTTRAALGKLSIENLTGALGANRFDRFVVALDCDVEARNLHANIRKLAGTVGQAGLPGGSLEMSGYYHADRNAGQITLKLADLNQNALRSFVAGALGDKTLTTVNINATTTARYDVEGESSVKADLKVSNLLVKDPAGKLPKSALGISLNIDGSMMKHVLDLRKAELTLAPTDRAKNQLQLSGKIDMANSNAISGRIKLAAESLDVTPYYELFAGEKKATKPGETPPPSPTPAPDRGNVEPPAIKLPFSQFTADVNIGRFYIREVAVTNFVTSVKLDDRKINVDPLSLNLNGAPVSARVAANVGVPGFQYDVTFSADKIPVEPIANSFGSGGRGQFKGLLLASAQVKGAGITGTSLQKTLQGQLGFTLTNANIQLVGEKTKRFVVPIATLLRLPELTQSPLNWMDAKVVMGGGNINLSGLALESAAFRADAAGIIPIADVLTNSPLNRLPVNVALSRNLAAKANLLPANTPSNAPYAMLPNFVKVGGTVGAAKVETDKAVITALLAQSVSGLVGGKAGGMLQGVGSLLGGRVTTPAVTTTNQVGTTNQSPPVPATNAPAKLSPFDLLNLLPKK